LKIIICQKISVKKQEARMKRVVKVVVVAVICQIFLITSFALASLPVKYKSEGCVVGGKVFNLFQGKRQYTFELPKEFNPGPYEGKKVMLEGDMYPGDYFVPKGNALQILGPCSAVAENNAPAPAKPAQQQPAKQIVQPGQKVVLQPEKPAVQQANPVVQQPAKPAVQSGQPVAQQPAKPAVQPTVASPASKPAQPPQNTATCRQNCQREYDSKIQNCAGYKLGRTAPACKDPITRDKDNCLKSCR
jgi:hypothetical protein